MRTAIVFGLAVAVMAVAAWANYAMHAVGEFAKGYRDAQAQRRAQARRTA